MPPSDDKSYIEELKKSLYSRNAPDVRTRRKLRYSGAGADTDMKTDWEHPAEPEKPVELNQSYENHSMSFFTKLLIASAVFCVLAVGAGAYLFFNGANLISANNIDIQISGPISVAGGEPVKFDVTAVNKNNVDLETVDMSVDFPEGTVDPADTATSLTSYRKLLGNIAAGASAHESVSAVMFGEENLQKTVSVTLTYSVKGSTAIFTKTQTYDVLISSSPLNVTVDSFKEITSGQEFDMSVAVKSNSPQTLKSVLLKAEYPFGYTFLTSNLKPLSDNATWKIGDIPSGGTRTVTIHGKLEGEDTDIRAFHFRVGSASVSDPKMIATEYLSLEQDLTIEKPFISLKVSMDGDAGPGDHVGSFGQPERVQVSWFNNLPVAVSNMQIDVKLSGSAYDKTAVQPDGGFFDSANNDIVWNPQTDADLATVASGDSGMVSFTITPRDLSTGSNSVVNPNLILKVNVAGSRPQERNVPTSVTSAITRTTKVSSNVSLSGRLVRTVGPFTNSGPVPPVAEQPTTYTVIWDADNTSSGVGNSKVTAKLPTYVKWLGAVNPTNENLTYDQNSGTITWDVGAVSTYTLGSSRRREVAFQVSFTPSVSQVSQAPVLIDEADLTATDNFTGSTLKSVQEPLTTRFSTDPAYKDADEIVRGK